MRRLTDRLCVAVATGFYLSYIPVKILERFSRRPPGRWTGSGFVGTLLGWATWRWVPVGAPRCAAALVLGILGASWASGVAERVLGERDDPRIIIDEVVGYWAAVAFLPRHAWLLVAGFVLFRFFDTVKLPPYRWLEDLPGGWGVVMDDVGAGIVANLCLRAFGHWALW